MYASGRTGFDDVAQMFGVAQRRRVLAQPGETRASRGGFERETLAQDASETRFAAGFASSQNLVEGEKIGAGEKGRRFGTITDARFYPGPARKRPNSFTFCESDGLERWLSWLRGGCAAPAASTSNESRESSLNMAEL